MTPEQAIQAHNIHVIAAHEFYIMGDMKRAAEQQAVAEAILREQNTTHQQAGQYATPRTSPSYL